MPDMTTGLEAIQQKPLWILALLGIFGVNPALDYVTGGSMGPIQAKLEETDDHIEEIATSVAILSGSVSNHISKAEQRLDELMEQINYNELRRQVEATIERKSRNVRENQLAIDDLDLSEMRRRSENTMTPELLAEYNRKRQELRSEIQALERQIRNEEAKLL